LKSYIKNYRPKVVRYYKSRWDYRRRAVTCYSHLQGIFSWFKCRKACPNCYSKQ